MMPTFANLETLLSIRTKFNNLVQAFLEPGLRSKNIALLLASTALTYSAGSLKTVAAGDVITTKTEGLSYEVVALGSASSQYELATAGGVLLKLLPDAHGWFAFDGMAPFKDGTTDNHAKVQTLLDNKSANLEFGEANGPSIMFSLGRYAFSDTINIKSECRLYGTSSGFGSTAATDFIFPAATAGIIVNRFNTLGAGSGSGFGGDGTEIVGIRLIGGRGDAFDETKSGVWFRARGRLEKCVIIGFAGHGAYFAAGSDSNPYLGNVNLARASQIFVQSNRGSGVHIEGTDANAGTFAFIDAKNNDLWGVYEDSFLGNLHFGHHSESNLAGCYFSDNKSAFIGCYAENGLGGNSQLEGITLGHTITDVADNLGPTLTSEFANGPRALLNITGGFRGKHSTGTTDIGAESQSIFAARHDTQGIGYPFRLHWETDGVGAHFRWASSSARLINFNATNTTNSYGRSSPVGESTNIPDLFLGNGNNARRITVVAALPTSGEVARGEVFILNAPSSGGVGQAHCTTGGIAGSTAVFRNAANLASS